MAPDQEFDDASEQRAPSQRDESDDDSVVEKPPEAPYVVGIGASAGGLDALESFLEALPAEPGMAFVIVQHLSPDFDSDLVDLLGNHTTLPISSIEEGVEIEPNHVYVIAPDTQITVDEEVLHTEELPDLDQSRATIDRFFSSLAEDIGTRAVGVLLSGSGSDGTAGLRAIRNHGGLTMAQDLEEAGVDSMPGSAVDADVVDAVSPVAQLAERLGELARTGRRFDDVSGPSDLAEDETHILEDILHLLHDRTGHDFSRYKRPTLMRRIGRRMQVLHLETLADYLERLQEDADEIQELFDELLIGVTEFFRDADSWAALRREVLPELFEGKGPEDTVRAWVPGCGTGQEAYTVAALLVAHADQMEHPPKVKIFATDLDRDSIEFAREGRYPAKVATEIPDDLLNRMFTPDGDDYYRVSEHLRSRVLFAVHNAIADPPFSNLDLVTCRNLLIYLQPTAQRQLLQLIHYGLNEEGWLLTGTSETIAQTPELFESTTGATGLYKALASSRSEMAVPGPPFGFDTTQVETPATPADVDDEFDLGDFHRDSVVANHAPPSVLVDENYRVLHVLGDVDPFVNVPQGRPTDDILEMVSDALRPRVRALLFEVFQADGEQSIRHVSMHTDSGERQIAVQASPVSAGDHGGPYAQLSFRTLRPDRHPPPLQRTGPPDDTWDAETVIQQLERQLEQMRSRLQTTVEDYESSNEKLRASNEELMSMNEELQSTTEELETSKEELRSLNEELTTVNQELNAKVDELDAVNNDLENLLRSTEIGTIFLNRDLELRRFTDPVTEYFHVLPSDVGRPLEHVNHELDTDSLLEDARRALDELETIEREVATDDRRHFLFRALPYVTSDDRVEGVVLTFVDITARKRMEEQLAESELKFRTVFESAADPMVLHPLDKDSRPQTLDDANGMAVAKTGLTRDELSERTVCELLTGEDFDCRAHLERLTETGKSATDARLETADDSEPIPVEVRAKRIEIGTRPMVVEVLRDVSEQRRYEEALVESKERAEQLAELRSMLLSTLSHDVRSPLTGIVTMTHILLESLEGEERDMVERIERSAEQLRQILDSVLRMASIETSETVADAEPFELVETVEEVLELHQARADREDLTLEYSGASEPVDVTLDPGFVTQILNNLVENALKYTASGGVTVHLEADDANVRLCVEDTGVGIPAEERDNIFGQFETGAQGESPNSIGLGLAITELLVEALDGSIAVDSIQGSGTRFSVELPRHLEDDPTRDV